MINKLKKILLRNEILLKNISYSGHSSHILNKINNDKVKLLNVSCGGFDLDGWELTDYETGGYDWGRRNIKHYDITSMDKLPFEENYFDNIYCSHVIEHFNNETSYALIQNMFNTLKNGGILRIACPDADLSYRAMLMEDHEFFIWDYWNRLPSKYNSFASKSPYEWSIEEKWISRFANEKVIHDKTPSNFKICSEEIKNIVSSNDFENAHDIIIQDLEYKPEYSFNHINWYNFQKIRDLGSKIGFSKTFKSGYLQSISPFMRIEGHFDTTWPQMSLYIDLIK